MPNTINSQLVDRIYAMGLKSLRRQTTLLQYCTRYDALVSEPSFHGDTVTVPIPADYAESNVVNVVPSNTPPVPTDITPRFASVQLSNWRKADFHLTDREVSQLQEGTMSDQFAACMEALGAVIIRSVFANFTGIYQFAGVAGTTPFASNTAVAQAARRLLNRAGVPMDKRALILDFDADANAIGLAIFQQYLQKGDTETLREGVIKRALGFDWATDAYLPSFTGGTLSNGTTKSALINKANVAIGDTTVPIDSATLTGTVVIGDLFTVAGDSQQYVVTANATASGNAIASMAFSPSARVAWADNAVVTFVANHAVAGLAIHPQAIAFASKPLDNVMPEGGGGTARQMFDPVSGLTLCLEITRQYKQTVAEFSCLWGSTLARPECAVRILG
jgi:hypothetical protein